MKWKSGETLFGVFVRSDGKSIYLRGSKPTAKVVEMDFKRIKVWGRVFKV
jgi:hypothetical protein